MKDGFEAFLGCVMVLMFCIFAGLALKTCNDSEIVATNRTLAKSCEQVTKLGTECRLVTPYTCRIDGNVMTCAVYVHDKQAEMPPKMQ